MNVLLWRAEYGETARGSRVSSDVVIDKIFNAPDASSLQVFQNGRSLGFIRWEIIPDEVYFGGTNQPVGRVESIRGYTVALDGRLDVEPLQRKLRFNLRSTLDATFDWQSVHATINLPPSSWDVMALATNQMLTVKHEGALGQWERTMQLGEMRDPATALESLGGPLVASLLKPLLPGNLPLAQTAGGPPALGLEWLAYNDAIRLGSTRVRIYRIEARLLGDRVVTVLVSRVGEILQVKMPSQLQITNENIPLREGGGI